MTTSSPIEPLDEIDRFLRAFGKEFVLINKHAELAERVDTVKSAMRNAESLLSESKAQLTKYINQEKIKLIENLPISDYDSYDGESETWFEFISLEDRDKAISELQNKEQS